MPAIQRDFCATASRQLRGEMLARCDHRSLRAGWQPHEHPAPAERMQAKTDFIILGDASGIERRPVLRREKRERVAGESAADPRRRNAGAKRLAHDQLFAMGFGELVEI